MTGTQRQCPYCEADYAPWRRKDNRCWLCLNPLPPDLPLDIDLSVSGGAAAAPAAVPKPPEPVTLEWVLKKAALIIMLIILTPLALGVAFFIVCSVALLGAGTIGTFLQ